MIKTMSKDCVCVKYKRPSNEYILGLMEEYLITDKTSLLNNLEKIIPISKVLKGRDSKIVYDVKIESNKEYLIFHLFLVN